VPRRGVVKKREVLPDPLFLSPLATRFINAIMQDGKKTVAQGIFYGAMEIIRGKTNDDPLKVFKKALDNVKPMLEVKSRRVGGATYQVPVEVAHERRLSLSIRWLIQYSKMRNEKTMREKLANEFMDASNHQGAAVRKKEDTHRMAEANKAFAHYRW
jgi:small subunit ribosomal protein S7